MSNSRKIVVIGSSNTDMVAVTDEFPGPGETRLGSQFMMTAGGKGANQAVAAARTGADVVFIGKRGNDPTGKERIEGLKTEGIDVSAVAVDEANPSGVALIFVDKKGENCIVIAPGSNMTLSTNDVDKAKKKIKESEIVLMQLEIPLDTVIHAAKMAHKLGKKVILNPAPAAKLPNELYPNLYLITPNESETEILTGVKVTDETTAAEAAEILRERGVDIVIITMGSAGAYIHTDEFKEIIPAPKAKAIDATAAGDCFNGALAVGLAEGKDLEETVHFANVAASISVTRMGAQASLPYRKELPL